MPKVSVIIPNFNHAAFLKRRIDSVLNQTYRDFEVILLDDCSTDNSVEILNSYKDDPRVSHIVINTENSRSPFRQWNKGFELAQGDYIWIAESDDWCETTLLENLITPLIADSSLVLAFAQSLVVTTEGNIIYRTVHPLLHQKLSGRDFVVSYMFADPVLINAGMVVFSKKALGNIDQDYLNFQSAGDWLFWNSVAIQGNVYVSGKYLNYFTRDKATVSSRAEVSGVDMKEGCRVFSWVQKKLLPSASEIEYALDKRIDIFLEQEKIYSSAQVRDEAFSALTGIAPEARARFYTKKMKRMLKRLI
jgi:glycosyltransferase involved in cell wall biosynthesis